MKRLPVVGVMGSGTEDHAVLAKPLGVLLASKAVHLLTGGGKGVMEAVSKAFVSVAPRAGSCIGIIPGGPDGKLSKPGYPNRYVEIPIYTHLPLSGAQGTDPLSRNHINVLTSDILVFLPGGEGTRSELQLANTYNKTLMHFGPLPVMGKNDTSTCREVSSLKEVNIHLDEWLYNYRDGI